MEENSCQINFVAIQANIVAIEPPRLKWSRCGAT